MKKIDLRNEIIEMTNSVDCNILKVYGVSCGVGYDLIVNVSFKNGGFRQLKAHATR